jgi:Lrp/AsnC family leucine-responsive transcriptional regulator
MTRQEAHKLREEAIMSNFTPSQALDRFDLKILDAIQRDSGQSNVELAGTVGLSPSPCLRRVRALEARGYIAGYRAMLDRHALGLGVRAFVEVRLEGQAEGITERFLERIQKVPEVVSCYLMTGAMDYLLEVVATDLDAYAEFTTRRLIGLPGLKEVRTSFVLREVKRNDPLPLAHLANSGQRTRAPATHRRTVRRS